MTVSQRINYNNAVLTYKALNNLTPAYISDVLTPTAIAYNRNLRSSENGSYMVPKTRTSFYTGSSTVSGSKLSNTFPTSVKQSTSLNTVKGAMIEYILKAIKNATGTNVIFPINISFIHFVFVLTSVPNVVERFTKT